MATPCAKYLTDPAIKAFEREARASRRGLWTDAAPVALWEWRRDDQPHQPATRAIPRVFKP